MAEPLAPDALPRRSPLWRRLAAAGARFAALGDAAVAEDYGDAEAEAARARRAGLVDLTPLPRWGLKGPGAHAWLRGRGIEVPEANNRATPLPRGGLVARLSDGEALLLAGPDGAAAPIDALTAAWTDERRGGTKPGGYPVPRGDSHAWLRLLGADAPTMLAKVCAVDLRPVAFDDRAVAQTSLAHVSVIAIHEDAGGAPAYHLLADFASAEYLWEVLLDAAAEYAGGPVGWAALRRLAG